MFKSFWKILPYFVIEKISLTICEKFTDQRGIYVRPFKNTHIYMQKEKNG